MLALGDIDAVIRIIRRSKDRDDAAAKLRKRPAPGKWSVSEILAHLADAEIVGSFRMRLILGAPGTPIASPSKRGSLG